MDDPEKTATTQGAPAYPAQSAEAIQSAVVDRAGKRFLFERKAREADLAAARSTGPLLSQCWMSIGAMWRKDQAQ